MDKFENNRKSEYPVDSIFIERWSPRAFSSKPVEEEKLMSIFEAAKWSPSCYNDQPWMFLYGKKEQDLKIFRSILVEQNQVWAKTAPVLAIVFAKKHFSFNLKPNRWAEFDCGAAWMSMTLQANKLGLHTHAMAGFSSEKAYEFLGVPEDKYTAIAAIAIGYRGSAEDLPADLGAKEYPNERKPLNEIIIEGRYQ